MGPGTWVAAAPSPGLESLPPTPVYLAALGPQMLRLAGETADGALLNWATPERIAVSRSAIDAGAGRAGRDPGAVPMTMYIRVCIDDDAAAARLAFAAQVLGYAMGRPGIPEGAGYRGLFAQMGFGAELSELEQRRDRGAVMQELVAAVCCRRSGTTAPRARRRPRSPGSVTDWTRPSSGSSRPGRAWSRSAGP